MQLLSSQPAFTGASTFLKPHKKRKKKKSKSFLKFLSWRPTPFRTLPRFLRLYFTSIIVCQFRKKELASRLPFLIKKGCSSNQVVSPQANTFIYSQFSKEKQRATSSCKLSPFFQKKKEKRLGLEAY